MCANYYHVCYSTTWRRRGRNWIISANVGDCLAVSSAGGQGGATRNTGFMQGHYDCFEVEGSATIARVLLLHPSLWRSGRSCPGSHCTAQCSVVSPFDFVVEAQIEIKYLCIALRWDCVRSTKNLPQCSSLFHWKVVKCHARTPGSARSSSAFSTTSCFLFAS